MPVEKISNLGEFNSTIQTGTTLVDFYADWCGPCKKIAPFLEDLSSKYPDVKFRKVNVDEAQDIASSLGIRSMPTFHVYVNGSKKDELIGANPQKLEALVTNNRSDVFASSSSGNKLGGAAPGSEWDGVGMPPPGNTRDARLKAFGHFDAKKADKPAPAPTAAPVSMDVDDEEEAIKQAIALSMQEDEGKNNDNSKQSDDKKTEDSTLTQDEKDHAEALKEVQDAEIWDGEEMVPLPVDESLLKQLIDMGFSDVRSRKGIHHGKTLDGAVTWITEHQGDADIDQAYMVKKKDTIPKIPLTPEELAAKVEATKQKIIERRAEKAKMEKEEGIRREKERRERGKQMTQTQNERDVMVRKREMDRQKREKQEAQKERQRVLAEIARDKAIRKANNGKLPSVLGVDGYNPSIASMNEPSGAGGGVVVPDAVVEKKDERTPQERITQSLERIMRYRTGGDGGNALKLLQTFIKNIVENPDEMKYRSINAESGAFKKKLAPLTGPVTILKALGFEKNDEDKFVYPENADKELLASTLTQINEAAEKYKQMNS